MRLLDDPEWAAWSDSEVGRRCCVDHKTVARIRADLGISQDRQVRLVERGGKTFEQNTARIGRAPTPAPVVLPRRPGSLIGNYELPRPHCYCFIMRGSGRRDGRLNGDFTGWFAFTGLSRWNRKAPPSRLPTLHSFEPSAAQGVSLIRQTIGPPPMCGSVAMRASFEFWIWITVTALVVGTIAVVWAHIPV